MTKDHSAVVNSRGTDMDKKSAETSGLLSWPSGKMGEYLNEQMLYKALALLIAGAGTASGVNAIKGIMFPPPVSALPISDKKQKKMRKMARTPVETAFGTEGWSDELARKFFGEKPSVLPALATTGLSLASGVGGYFLVDKLADMYRRSRSKSRVARARKQFMDTLLEIRGLRKASSENGEDRRFQILVDDITDCWEKAGESAGDSGVKQAAYAGYLTAIAALIAGLALYKSRGRINKTSPMARQIKAIKELRRRRVLLGGGMELEALDDAMATVKNDDDDEDGKDRTTVL
jgi:hypothetical protein